MCLDLKKIRCMKVSCINESVPLDGNKNDTWPSAEYHSRCINVCFWKWGCILYRVKKLQIFLRLRWFSSTMIQSLLK